jgi:hypothetical protein
VSAAVFPRVVALTEKTESSNASRRARVMVVFPTPEGPEMTSSSPAMA